MKDRIATWQRAQRFSLMTKLSLFVTAAVLLVLTVLGYYFDDYLQQRFLHDTQQRMQRGYERLADNLKTIERELREGIAFIKTSERTIASIELVNNYQDKNHYNTFLLDEEKKALAAELLSRVKLSFNSDIALYDQNGELIAFVMKGDQGYKLSFISFDGGERKVFQRMEQRLVFSPGALPAIEGNISLIHKDYYGVAQPVRDSLITYHRLGDNVIVKSHQNIFQSGSDRVLGHIEISRILDAAFFDRLSKDSELDIRPVFTSEPNSHVESLSDTLDVPPITVQESNGQYFGMLKKADSRMKCNFE